MEELLFSLLLASGFGALWWQRARLRRQLGTIELAEGAEIALHVARHEAESRSQPVAPLHLLFGLTQHDDVAAAIRTAGGDVEALEDRLLDELAGHDPRTSEPTAATRVLAWAVYMARARGEAAGCADLWGGLIQTAPETASLVDSAGVSAVEVLFAFVHGELDEPPAVTGPGQVEVVLINDHITTQQLVVELLRDTFDFDEQTATERMLEVHHRGESSIARMPAADAARKVEAARRVARAQGYPLRFRIRSSP